MWKMKTLVLLLLFLASGCVSPEVKSKPEPEYDYVKVEAEQKPIPSHPYFKPYVGRKKPQDNSELGKLSRVVDKGLNDGIFHSIDVELYEVRMDPLVWASLSDIETKRATVRLFIRYFKLKNNGVGGIATIRSKYSDEKLADVGWLGGIKIYK